MESVGEPAFTGLGGFGAEGRAKITDFIIYFRVGFDGLCHFFPQKSAISPAELMKQTLHRQLRHSEGVRKFFITDLITVGGKVTLQNSENSTATFAFAFEPKPA